MVVLEGCVQPALRPQINTAAARVLDRLDISLLRVPGETCCGALSHHLSRPAKALAQAQRNIDACVSSLDAGAEAIISTTSACGLMFKDYARLLADDPQWSGKAERVSAATRDISEVIDPDVLHGLVSGDRDAGTVTWQAPCTLQHGQRLTDRVEPLLEAAGYRVLPVAESTLCCGSAGTYSILQPELSGELKQRKLTALLSVNPQYIATANIGCLEHLRAASPVPVGHWVELLNAACAR
jgi:glycolate oxidase iron-sulfur subunit